jgi:hypothetical protein
MMANDSTDTAQMVSAPKPIRRVRYASMRSLQKDLARAFGHATGLVRAHRPGASMFGDIGSRCNRQNRSMHWPASAPLATAPHGAKLGCN